MKESAVQMPLFTQTVVLVGLLARVTDKQNPWLPERHAADKEEKEKAASKCKCKCKCKCRDLHR